MKYTISLCHKEEITMDNELYLRAVNRYETKNQLTLGDFQLSMRNFILKIYCDCDPATYGKAFTNKIIHDFPNTFNVVRDTDDIGDLSVTYPIRNRNYDSYNVITGKMGIYMLGLYGNEVKKIHLEGKISYLSNKTQTYTVRNIRIYQNFNYFVFCLVDCDDKFEPEFIVVEKEVITKGPIKLHIMNGTKDRNKNNTDVGVGFAFKKGSKQYHYLLNNNKVKGNHTYEDFMEFITLEGQRLKHEFWNWENHLSNIERLYERIKTEEDYNNMFMEGYRSHEFMNYPSTDDMIKELIENGWERDERDTWQSPYNGGYYHGVKLSYETLVKYQKLKDYPFKKVKRHFSSNGILV